ncbi:hypothetical protein MNBD_GAMMA25-2251 [hydrothermal vent metagenome]|uniref:Uncharacterized protein n=1 Tax=hydrothermal vent metagenome TaxID=652676 RepID=A0A3B1AY88_9ZZZZ
MKKDVYNLICKGELVHGFELSDVIVEVEKLFKVDETVALQIVDKKHHVIIKKVTWQQAIKYRNMLKNIGLVIYPKVVLDKNVFKESLVPVMNQPAVNNPKISKRPGPDKTLKVPLQLMSLDITKLIPTILSMPHSEPLVDNKNVPMFDLESYNHALNPTFLLLGSMFTALIVEKYFALIMVQDMAGHMVTAMSIVLFFLIIIFIPRVMSPNRVFTLSDAKDSSTYLLCAQIPSINPFIYEYYIYSYEDTLLATIKNYRLKNRMECLDMDKNILYFSSEEYYADDVAKDVARELRDEIFELGILSYINVFSRLAKKVSVWFSKHPHAYQRNDAFVIRDKNANKIAYYYKAKNSAMELPVHVDNEYENKTMMAFLLVCIGIA